MLTVDYANMCDDGYVPGSQECCGIGSCNIFCCKYGLFTPFLMVAATMASVFDQPIAPKTVTEDTRMYLFPKMGVDF